MYYPEFMASRGIDGYMQELNPQLSHSQLELGATGHTKLGSTAGRVMYNIT